MIDVEFAGDDKKDREATRAWDSYRDQLNNKPRDTTAPRYQEQLDDWGKEGNRLFNELLDKIGKAL